MPEHILSLSYGKDSIACLGAIEQLGWPLDRVVTAEVWATDTIPADLPPMVEFKKKADKIIKERWGIEVEHVRADVSFEEVFYFRKGRTGRKTKSFGQLYGWPMKRGQWCLRSLKLSAINKVGNDCIQYVGIAADECDRFNNLSDLKKSPLVEIGWTEAMCWKFCEDNDLLSPIYKTTMRGGCWFCYNQSVGQLRMLRKNYPNLWKLMLKWDADSPTTFTSDGRTVLDYDIRFHMEDNGLLNPQKRFLWKYVDEYKENMND